MKPAAAPSTPPGRSRARAAFTLLELLIAVGLLAMLATMLFLILDATSRLWRENERRVDSYREARAALNLIARELRSWQPLDPAMGRSLVVNPQPADGIALPAAAAAPAIADSIWFTSLIPPKLQHSGKNKSDLCALGYYLAWTPNPGAGGGSSYKLYRHFRSSDDTFAAIQAGQPLYQDIKASVDNNNDILARNITSLKIRPFEITSNGTLALITPVSHLGPPQNVRPRLIEIEIRAINAETAAKLASKTDWENPNHPLIKQNEQVFTTRVVLTAAQPQP